MPDNFKKPSYNRKQQLYVEKSTKKSPQNNKQLKNTKSKNNKNIAVKNNKELNIPSNNKNKNKCKLSFKRIALLSTLLVLLFSTVTFASYKYFVNDTSNSDVDPNLSTTVTPESEPLPPENINVLLVGLDKGSYHTDTMIVANLNTADGSVELISIPRDTYAVIPEEVVNEIYATQENPIMPRDGQMKLTELITYTQDFDLGFKLLEEYIETVLNIEIKNRVAVNLESFSYLIDEIGGVYFDVPRRMYYTDNAQDLHIDLQPGYQLLTGDQAEQLIRFRKGDASMGSDGYAMGDLGRIEVQQAFLKEVINQVLSKDNIMGNLVGLAKTYYTHVTTDINILDIPKYSQYALSADKNNITTYSLPVEYDYIGNKSYAIVQDEELAVLRDKVFYDIEPVVEEVAEESTEPVLAKAKEKYTITILNGSNKSGFAGRTSTMLQENGFKILDIGDYTDVLQEKTRFFVNNTEHGAVLESYFDEAEVVYSPSQTEDIIVVLGTNETLKGKE